MPLELADDADLDLLLKELQNKHGVPGLAAGVLVGDAAYASVAGVTSVRDPLPVDVDTLFFIGSTSKTMTATAVMALVEQGAIALDDPVRKHLPEFTLGDPAAAEAVTVRMLLNHTGGWRGDVSPITGWGDDALDRAVTEVVAHEPQLFAPGGHVSYNNSAVMVAGRLIEKVTQQPFENAVRNSVLAPLALTNTWFLPWEVAQRRLAVGHLVRDGVATPVPEWPLTRAIGPAGGAISSLADQLSYMRFHLAGFTDANAPITEDSRLLMQQQTASARSAVTGVGLSWLLNDRAGTRLVSHGGNVSNLQCSHFAMAPEATIGVTVLANSQAGAEIGRVVTDWALERHGHIAPLPTLPRVPLTTDLAADFVGRYDAGAWQLDVTQDGDELVLRTVIPGDEVSAEVRELFEHSRTRLVPLGDDQVGVAERCTDAAGDFIRSDDGEVVWLRWGMRMSRRMDPAT
jgi:CubicO group peptidase (beta-lactamase class C family)